jgi:hypothetical protein
MLTPTNERTLELLEGDERLEVRLLLLGNLLHVVNLALDVFHRERRVRVALDASRRHGVGQLGVTARAR